ncbi:helix-turn-helix transcriptional regulator [Microlunatus antarcticus]|uniref:Transcriptional regulator with XRE-family HTH domain n=1 Tax=Microlunatus antarcticus TaxID=53388 RepID=A0A7W5JVY9_9ACTN|nr:helix-turn-helix transcriptional regulator [Microlunatus antarcticus]MBB3326762.1 transcriptional regulator with XRE-family HTH domain [Microlunatus antarcticus]
MDNRSEVRDFLTSRRARLRPEQVGLTSRGARRVPGLRRAEAAQLAGVSIEYYTRLERGNLSGASEAVLDSLARGLRLDESERAYLFDLARSASASTAQRRPARPTVRELRPSIGRLLDAMVGVPAFVRNGRLDVLAINTMGRALYSVAYERPERPVNLARFVFLDPRAHLLHPDWEASAATTVAILRTEAGRDPFDKGLTDLVGELSTRSDDFRRLWAAHDVRLHRFGAKHFRHAEVGDLDLTFDALELPGEPDLTLTAYSAEPGTVAADNLALLASWAATHDQTPSSAADGSPR